MIYNLLDAIRVSAILLRSFLPQTSEKILKSLNTEKTTFEDCTAGVLECGIQIAPKSENLFNRIDAAKMLETIHNELQSSTILEETPKVEHKPEITIDDFSKVELTVGQVVACEKHPKADKLLVSQIDIGHGENRQIVSGIATHIRPEDFVGKKVVVVTNLKPANLRGVKSEGMILAGENDTTLEVLSINDLKPGDNVH